MNADKSVQKLEGDVVVFTSNSNACGGARVALVTDSGDEYAIVPKGAGVDLAELLSARVAVSCEIRTSEGDAACIQVRRYTILDEFPDE